MPAICGIDCNKNTLTMTTHKGTFTFDAGKIPIGADTGVKLETYLNQTWIPSIAGTDIKMEVHILTYAPLSVTVYTTNPGEKIPAFWWMDQV